MLGDKLTHKQFIFCEAYLRHFNVDKACREAYPNMNTRNGSNVLKSRKVLEYIRERLKQKRHTMEMLTDKMLEKLSEKMEDADPQVALEATKQVARLTEIDAKIKQLEVDAKSDQEQTINIRFTEATADGD